MPICIAGMHRSGTSMVTKILRGGGLYLGDEADLMPALPDNADGFWENVRFVEQNDQILESQGGWWDCPPELADGWTDEVIRENRSELEALLRAFDGRELWGWKDPRSSLTIELWLKLMPELKVVICLRNPLEVALSLRKRNTFSYALSLRLWHAYNQTLLSLVPADRRIVTHYATYFEEPAGEVARVLAFAGIPLTESTIADGVAATSRSLRHSHLTMQHMVDARVPAHVIDLYLRMCQEAGWLGEGPLSSLPGSATPQPTQKNVPVHPAAPHLGAARLDRLAILKADVDQLRQELDCNRALQANLTASEQENKALREELSAAQIRLDSNLTLQASADAAEQENKTLQDALSDAKVRLALAVAREQPLREMLAEAQKRALDLESRPIAAAETPPPAPVAVEAPPAKLAYYRSLERVLGTLSAVIPNDARVLVVSKGDDALLQLDGRTAEHFPQDEKGSYSGYTPSDSADAIRRLDALLQHSGCWFVLPSWAFWWTDFYADFAKHLDTVGRRAWADAHCVVYELPALPSRSRPATERARRARVGER